MRTKNKNDMKRTILSLCLSLAAFAAFGQGAKNIRINEVQTRNLDGPIDECGDRNAWVELANTAYSTYNVRGMFITTDRRVLDRTLSVPEREALMSRIPDDDEVATLSARQHTVLFLGSNPHKGNRHLDAAADWEAPLWIALYDGNAVDLIDSVTVPVLAANESYARLEGEAGRWSTRPADCVTPGTENFAKADETKIRRLKRDDPHGFGITILSMGIVFGCLALLYVFFRLLGIFMGHREALARARRIQPIKAAMKTGEILAETGHRTKVMLTDGMETGGIDKEVYIAVISMALKQYQDDVHDVEPGVITITRRRSAWSQVSLETAMPERK